MDEFFALALTASFCLAGHALADGLQGRLSMLKRRRLRDGHVKKIAEWAPFLAAHGGWHAIAAGAVLASPEAMICEWAAHCAIDFCKCEGRIGAVTDQILHLACKAAWIAIWGVPAWASSVF